MLSRSEFSTRQSETTPDPINVPELSTPENERIVSRIYEAAMGELHAGRSIPGPQRLIHDVEHLMQEVNSGASFTQYFQWASLNELAQIERHLQELDLADVAGIVSNAMSIAFPGGLPATDAAKESMTEWTPQQEGALSALFSSLEQHNGRVTNVMAAYASRAGLAT